MSNTAVTQQILQSVENAKSRARTAEQAFDRANSSIQRKASYSIDLFGGSAQSTVADIARDARRACDDLYSAYQSLIITLDETCRPLLSQDPDMQAVKTVAELMKKLNDDSEIESNFTASLNGTGLGDVAGSRYVPSMNCKMIQRYWEDRYASWPGRAELEAQARQKEQELKQAAEVEAKKQYDAQMQEYEQAMLKYEQEMQKYRQQKAQWEAEVLKVEKARKAELKAKEEAYTKEQCNLLLQAFNQKTQELEQAKALCEKERDKARADLAQAGFFAFGKKKAAKNRIVNQEYALVKLEREFQNAKTTYYVEKGKVESETQNIHSRFLAAIEEKYPLPPAPYQPTQPIKPRQPRPVAAPSFSAPYRVANPGTEDLKQAILDSMIVGEKYTITEIIMTCSEVADMTNQQVSALVRQLVSAGDLIRTEDSRKAYFELA